MADFTVKECSTLFGEKAGFVVTSFNRPMLPLKNIGLFFGKRYFWTPRALRASGPSLLRTTVFSVFYVTCIMFDIGCDDHLAISESKLNNSLATGKKNVHACPLIKYPLS